MATNEPPPQRKRKVEKIGPTVEEEERTFYVLEQGRYIPVKKGSDGDYVVSRSGTDGGSGSESDEDVDPALKKEYDRQISESGGFDLDLYIPNGSLMPFKCSDSDTNEIGICAKVGLHWYNLLKGSTYRLLKLDKYNSILTGIITYYITAKVVDPATTTNSPLVFQTCVTRASSKNNEDFRIETEVSTINKTHKQAPEDYYCHWNDEAIHNFYKSDLKWLPDNALVQSNEQYYELQDKDIRDNDWVQLYVEYAFFPLWESRLTKVKFGAPLEIIQMVVQTHQVMEPTEMLKAGNAVFYISFRDCGRTENHRAVVRRTTNGHPEHVCLEVKSLAGDLSS